MLAVLISASGALLAWAPTAEELPTPPAASLIREFIEWDEPPALPYKWSAIDLDFVIPGASRKLTKLEFAWRYTIDEQVALERLAVEHPDPNIRATLRVLEKSLDRASESGGIDRNDPRTVQGVQFHVAVGAITAERALEILEGPLNV